ncbi:MAG: hypothetical protein HY044_03170 [Candidatus Woesebacteria bacterium]|nr:MAG: hypothetical protein HY044_03170 [Candidatus Woesebacteria bacterium]
MSLSVTQKLAKDQFDKKYQEVIKRINIAFGRVDANGSDDLRETLILISDFTKTLNEQQIPFNHKEPGKLPTFGQTINSCFSFIHGLLNDLEKLLEEQSQPVSKS